MPLAKNRKIAEMSLRFCTKWEKRVGLLHHMIGWLHEYNLIGEVYIFAEDANPEMPEEVRYEEIREINDETESITERRELRPDADRRAAEWMRRNYKGWTDVQVLPPERRSTRTSSTLPSGSCTNWSLIANRRTSYRRRSLAIPTLSTLSRT
jgi:hypothetical protein